MFRAGATAFARRCEPGLVTPRGTDLTDSYIGHAGSGFSQVDIDSLIEYGLWRKSKAEQRLYGVIKKRATKRLHKTFTKKRSGLNFSVELPKTT